MLCLRHVEALELLLLGVGPDLHAVGHGAPGPLRRLLEGTQLQGLALGRRVAAFGQQRLAVVEAGELSRELCEGKKHVF